MTDGARPRILVIDDHESVCAFVCAILKDLGYDADGAEGGRTGLTLLARQGYDLVITDLAMPEMSGWEVVEAVRHRAPGLPVMIISGFATDEDVARAQRIGVVVLHKPFSKAELSLGVARLLPPEAVAKKPLAKAPEVKADPREQPDEGRGPA